MSLRTFSTRSGFAFALAVFGVLGACGPDKGDDLGDGGGGGDGGGADQCKAGLDSDLDGVPNDEECRLGTNSNNADSDGDGALDGKELMYGKICVATDPAMQTRPPVVCTGQAGCGAGEACKGLDPTMADSDGDGVPDGQEDRRLDGTIDVALGETDPRLLDTDGDGVTDGMGGLDICRPAGLATVTTATLPGMPSSVVQVGHDPAWGVATTVTGASAGAVVLDDATATVAAAVFSTQTVAANITAEATRLQGIVSGALGAGTTPILLNQTITTHENQAALGATYRVARMANPTNASALRDGVVMAMTGTAAPGGTTTGASAEFIVDMVTVFRASGTGMGKTDVAITIAPSADYNNVMRPTSIRALDLVNTTAIAEAGKGLGFACQVFRATQSAVADFLWTVDTSGSMGDDQTRLADASTRFFSQMQAAGVDFRVAVLQAGSGALDVANPGLTFISGSDAMGPKKLCEQVTSPLSGGAACALSPGETLGPYTFPGGQEEPTAAAVIAHDALKRRTADPMFRANAKIVTFHVTDEPGTNDFTRYFDMTNAPDNNMPWGTTYNAASLANIIGYFSRNNVLTYGLVPVTATACTALAVNDLPRCVIEGNGGATIPIATATQVEIDAAVSKIVLAVAGATSQFALTRSPITSTIKVKVRGMDVPRSRSQGFDYDAASKSIIFFGTTFRPMRDNEVVISYRVWEGSIG